MPRPCAVVLHVGFYIGKPPRKFQDATALSLGPSRWFLLTCDLSVAELVERWTVETNVKDHGTRPWHVRLQVCCISEVQVLAGECLAPRS